MTWRGLPRPHHADVTLPLQTDHDSDGLLSKTQGGTDPDDTQYDVDGDTLSDFASLEQSIGANPLLADTDGDRLSDAEAVMAAQCAAGGHRRRRQVE